MGLKLVLAEKPSVGLAYSKALGANVQKDGYCEGNGYIVTWCVGHLVELASADLYDEKYKKWNIADLPIIPREWKYVVSSDKSKQFDTVKTLMNDSRVTEIIFGTDAGREGELIARLVYEKAGCTKLFKRLWLSSMEEKAIVKAFDNLKDGAEFENLYQSALCRAKSDWAVGINATRVYAKLYNKKLNVGRVQTPTLAMICERGNAIANFVKEKYFNLHLNDTGVLEKIKTQSEAEKIKTECDGKTAVVRSVKREKKSVNPLTLYDLTLLQREANRLYGFTAQQTLDYAQSLYESRLISYPRTDSKYLTDDMTDTVKRLISLIPESMPQFEGFTADYDITRVINGKKVTDHTAIIPTIQIENTDLDSISSGEKKILLLIANKLLCAVSDSYVYESVTAKIECGGHVFTARGKTVIKDGWKSAEKLLKSAQDEDDEDNEQPLALIEGQEINSVKCGITEHFTKPPSAFTEDTLLSAMERAGTDKVTEEVERSGLGTPATRAGIIEKLIKSGFIERGGKKLSVTDTGKELVEIVPDILKSASFTAEWEDGLARIAQGKTPPDDFMNEVEKLTESIVATAKQSVNPALVNRGGGEVIGKCPRCNGDVIDTPKAFSCSCGFALWKANKFFESAGKEFTKEIAAALVNSGKTEVKGLYSQKTGKTYNAVVCLDDTGTVVNFKLEFPKNKKK